jgi:integrase
MIPAMADARAQARKAEAVRRELIGLREQDLEPSTQTLEAFLRSWLRGLRDARSRRIRPRTLEFYTMIVERHILPTLGHHRLGRLGERHVQAWLDADDGSPRSVHHHRAVLRRALNVAVRQRIIGRNPALGVELPELDDFTGDPLTVDEAHRLLEATAGDHLGALWRLALVTGLRSAEICAIAWDDVDFDAGALTVRHQLARASGSWILVDQTKGGRSLHRLAIDPATVAALRRHKRRMAKLRRADWRYHGLAFLTPGGKPIGRSELLRAFHAACDRAKVKRRRFHDLRVSSATLLAELGVDEHVRMARLGHATAAMARHYAVARDELDRDASTRLAEAIS